MCFCPSCASAVSCSGTSKCLDDGGEEDECAEDATGVDGSVVWQVSEKTAEDEVFCCGEERRAHEDEDVSEHNDQHDWRAGMWGGAAHCAMNNPIL